MEPCSRKSYCFLSPGTVEQLLQQLQSTRHFRSTFSSSNPCMLLIVLQLLFWAESCLCAPSGNFATALHLWVPFPPLQSVSNFSASVLPVSRHYRQSLHSATWPRRKSLQGQRRLYLGECPAQLKRRGSRWRPHSCRTTEKAGRMWLISESTTSHCTSNLRGEAEEQRSVYNLKCQFTGFNHRKDALERIRKLENTRNKSFFI